MSSKIDLLKFHNTEPGLYEAQPDLHQTIHAYEIDRGEDRHWEITVKRPMWALVGEHGVENFRHDMKLAGYSFRTLREAKEACQQHYEADRD